MDEQPDEYRLTFKQLAMRLLSVVVCGIGASACFYSISEQIAEVGTFVASAMWFSGLLAVVAALAGYAVTCDPGKKKGYIPIAVVCIAVIAVVLLVFEKMLLYDLDIIILSLIAFCIQGIALVVYHFILKSDDPYAL